MRLTLRIAQNREAVSGRTRWRVLLTCECWLQLEWPDLRSLHTMLAVRRAIARVLCVFFQKLRKPIVFSSPDIPTHVFRSYTGHEQPYRGAALASSHSLNIDLNSQGPAHTCRGYGCASCVLHAKVRCAWPPWQSHGARVSTLYGSSRRKALLWAMWQFWSIYSSMSKDVFVSKNNMYLTFCLRLFILGCV